MKQFLLLSSLLLPLQAALGAALPPPATAEGIAKVDYNGFKLFRVSVAQDTAAGIEEKLSDLAAHVLNPGHRDYLDVVVAPENIQRLDALAVESIVIDEDVGKSLAEEGAFVPFAVPDPSWFTAYHSFADHQTFLQNLQASFPSNSELINSGTSVEGRSIAGIHIWGSGGKGSKPAVLFHGTVHAREWIATMTAEYTAYQLLTQYNSSTAVKTAVDTFDFHILPIVNPDGFVYSQTTDRLWRKNRQTVSTSTCVGRDINRNWPFKWDVTGGASTNPCSETYKGLAAGDSPENTGLVAYVNKLRDSLGIRLFIDFHSYGQYILSPFGYDCSLLAPNNAALQSAAQSAKSAIAAVSGTSYTTGPSCSTLYATTGAAPDHVYSVGGAPYSYTIELRDTGRNGFTLPATQIQPTVVETWAGVLTLLGIV